MNISLVALFLLVITLLMAAAEADTLGPAFPVTIRVDAAHPIGDMHPLWRFFGADEPNYATRKNGEKLIGELGALDRQHVYFRAHNLLTTGDGTPAFKWGSTNAYTEDAQGRPVYDWTILDHLFDTYLKHGVRPYAQIGFMPEALSVRPEPYRHHWKPGDPYDAIYTGWSYPPKDYGKWGELVYQWVHHCVTRYGRAEVERWYWEVWNEPNIGYWRGTREEFFRLHDTAVAAVRRALPTARVGGPDMAGSDPTYLRAFLDHCLHEAGTPLDFVSFHAKGAPTFVDGHVRMGIAAQLRTMDGGFGAIASYPQLKNVPIVIGESDPDGCAACTGPQLGYRNGTMYSSYTAASIAREYELADRHGVNLEGALTWAFEFEDEPYFAGFRALATNGVDLPVLNVFRMLSRMGGQRLTVDSSAALGLDDILKSGVRDAPDVSALASRDGKRLSVLIWHYHDDDVPGPDAAITLTLAGLPASSGTARLEHFRIDADHSNAFTAWKAMGSPQSPTPTQYAQLEKAGQLTRLSTPATAPIADGQATLHFTLPRQGVSLLVLSLR
ncbi:MAG: beta-xylosidase [Armatimonadetes bacterium]|nr:beta-xylosidase [Armatimonadota bacterium]